MRIHIATLFPHLFPGPLAESITGRAMEKGLFELQTYNIRDHGIGRHLIVDDYPYGGGPGMLMKPEPIFDTVEAIQAGLTAPAGETPVVFLSPQGRLLTQAIADDLAQKPEIILLCGRYEGVDERVLEHLVTDEISVGDFVVTGGEIPAMLLIDAVVRRVPGVLGSEESGRTESHVSGVLEGPQYTRPPDYRGWEVPPVLLSGNHAEVDKWRRRQSLLRTAQRRPDLLAKTALTNRERQWLEEEGFLSA